MAKRGPKPKEVDVTEVERLARKGHQQHDIAAQRRIADALNTLGEKWTR